MPRSRSRANSRRRNRESPEPRPREDPAVIITRILSGSKPDPEELQSYITELRRTKRGDVGRYFLRAIDEKGYNPAHRAVECCRGRCIDILDVIDKFTESSSALKSLVRAPLGYEGYYMTPLLLAVENLVHPEVLDKLVEMGADPLTRDRLGLGLLHYAVMACKAGRRAEKANPGLVLLKHAVKRRRRWHLDLVGKAGYSVCWETPAHLAARNDDVPALEVLVDSTHGACLVRECRAGETPYAVAKRHKSEKVLQYIEYLDSQQWERGNAERDQKDGTL